MFMMEAPQAVLEGEMSKFPGATSGEQMEEHRGYLAGCHGRDPATRIGSFELQVSHVRTSVGPCV
ncbi:hypothetical protein [Aromatoleum toluclasticum]|uniref:hypothetical protein n=1 Tax=Aromatoleum toluclasticum TaxID=92003 RepID=UPI00036EE3CF|nr:hypothetical protein [Aromatoleum toluclasticum]